MEQMRPAVFPFYAAHLHPNLASMSPERFRFPAQPPFQFPAAMFPGLHPMAAHHHPQPHPHSHPGLPHPLAPPHSVLQARGLAPTPQPSPAHTHPPTSTQNLIHQALHVPLVQPLSISQEELDMILYGYAKSHNGDQCHGHALSGLNLTQAAAHQAAGDASSPEPVTFGIDKILSATQASPSSTHSSKTSQPTLDAAALELPEGIAIIQTTFAGSVHYGVFCTKTVIARGSRFGPFKGRIIHTSEIKTHDDNSYMWEIFQDGKLSHFIDGRGAAGNWMAHVKCARYAQEQNLIAVQADGAIWYEACKDIPQGTELLVWYGDCYLQFMGVPVALKEMADGGAQEEADTSEGFQCERCGKVFAYKYYRDKHLKYTRCVDQGDRKYPCTLCSRSFEKRDRLRIHILHVHEKHRPHKCMVCGKSFSQSSSLNKHMRVHSGERPYKCVYCNKAFTASSILRTHIRQHSGEKPFKCKHCGKAFASHAAHDSHVRRTHSKERPCTCNVCGKTFSQPFELKFHMSSHMNQ